MDASRPCDVFYFLHARPKRMPGVSPLSVSHAHRVGMPRLRQPTGFAQPAASAPCRRPALQRLAGTLDSLYRVAPFRRSLPHAISQILSARAQARLCMELPRSRHSLGSGAQPCRGGLTTGRPKIPHLTNKENLQSAADVVADWRFIPFRNNRKSLFPIDIFLPL